MLERFWGRAYLSAVSTPETLRLKLTIHYDGSRFHGWQVQPDVRTVQGEIEAAVERLTGEPRTVLGSGRTDTGVHATGQVATVDVPTRWGAAEFRRAMNVFLPADVWLESVAGVDADFHPRYHPVARTYVYRIGLSEGTRSPFVRPWCWPVRDTLELERLQRCASHFVGEHSFEALSKSGQPERGDVCTVRSAAWTDWGGIGVRFTVTADRFLHHMVRYMVGTMVDVARGRRPESDIPGLLDPERSDVETSPPAPPEGLFLARVVYPGAEDGGGDPTDGQTEDFLMNTDEPETD